MVPLPTEIDAANIALVEPVLVSALGGRPMVLIADGSTTGFCDSSGIGALVRVHHQAAATGAQLRVVITSSAVRRVLEISGADQLLDVYPSLAAARAGRSHPPEHQEIA